MNDKGWVPDLPLTPFQFDYDPIFNQKLYTGIIISKAYLGFYLISHQFCGEGNHRIVPDLVERETEGKSRPVP